MKFSPIILIKAYLKKVTQKRIFSGPFQGLFFVGEEKGSSYYSKILGIYKKELHGILEANKIDTFDKVLVIGTDQGYYAIGFAKKWKRPVIVFEENPNGQPLITRLSLINRTEVFIKGKFESHHDSRSKKDFIFMDIEGREDQLLDEERFQSWKESVILVEVHSTHIKESLQEKSKYTHNSFFTPVVERTIGDYPFDPPFSKLFKKSWSATIEENHPDTIGWIIFEPKA